MNDMQIPNEFIAELPTYNDKTKLLKFKNYTTGDIIFLPNGEDPPYGYEYVVDVTTSTKASFPWGLMLIIVFILYFIFKGFKS
jgi:hypothetical protein